MRGSESAARHPERSDGSLQAPRLRGNESYAAVFFLGEAFLILPERMQRVQAVTFFDAPPTTARTVFRFKFHLRFVTLWAWLTRWPLIGVFPQN
jgi:hypothetical protein